MTETARVAMSARRHADLSNRREILAVMVVDLLLVVSLWGVCVASRYRSDFMVIDFMTNLRFARLSQ